MERQKVFWIVLSVSVFLVVVLVAGVFLLRPRPLVIAAAGPGTGTLSDGSPVYEYQREAPPAAGGGAPGSAGSTGADTLHFYIGEGDEQAANGAAAGSEPGAAAPSGADAGTVQSTPTAPSTAAPSASTPRTSPAAAPAVEPAAAAASKTAAAPKTAWVTEYWIQVGSYKSQSTAEDLAANLTGKGLGGRVFSHVVQGTTWYRVRVGPYASRPEAEKFLAQVKAGKGLEASFIAQVGPVRRPVN